MRWSSRQVLNGTLMVLVLLGLAGAASAQTVNTFTNSTVIVITDAANATPFPSNITVAGQTGVITHVRVRLNGISHAAPLRSHDLARRPQLRHCATPGTTANVSVELGESGIR